MLDTWIKFIKAHEKMLLVAIVGLVLWSAIGKVDTLIASHDNANLQQVTLVAKQQAAQTAAVAAQVAQQANDMKALSERLETQNAQLVQANAALATAMVKQQKIDTAMTPSELTTRWNALVPNAGVSISNGQVVAPPSGALATVIQLEAVPALRTQVENDRTQLENKDTLITASQGQVATLNTEVTGLRLTIVDDAKVCQAQIKVVKDAAAKSKRRWFVAGTVVPVVIRIAVKILTGV
jgi:seryl-tRNA synthetase